MNKLFAYGTLRYEDEDPSYGVKVSKYLENTSMGKVKGSLYVIEGFPFLLREGDNWVKGKLFEFSETDEIIDKYDRIEGADKIDPFFERVVVKVHLEDGSIEESYCYVGGKSLKNFFAKPEYKVECGDIEKTSIDHGMVKESL